MSKNIKVGISVGDINGIGIEIIIKTLHDKQLLEYITPIIYCSPLVIEWYIEELRSKSLSFSTCNDINNIIDGEINVINAWNEDIIIEPGIPTRVSGEKALVSLQAAANDLVAGLIDVLVTAPIDKNNIQSNEFKFPGHTEYLASISKVDEALMLLVDKDLRVGVLTGHIPLKDVSVRVTKSGIIKKLKQIHSSLKSDFGIIEPKIAVLGLNPHAGDNGLIGDEEIDIIIPAIEMANQQDMIVDGPFASDGIFGSKSSSQYDAILAMYHDQGLIPFKVIAFDTGVNYTAGLPIIRTSPDHGTAFDIAGMNKASHISFRNAIDLSVDIFKARNK